MLMIVGNRGGTNVGESFWRASIALGWKVAFRDARQAYHDSAWLQRISWHLAGHRPWRLIAFSHSIEKAAKNMRPGVLLSTGLAPITAKVLLRLKAQDVTCLHYSTDDPWNSSQRAGWFLRTLPIYDQVFTTRRSNLDDLRRIGANASYLPFGYDPELFFPDQGVGEQSAPFDILFVGGADHDRASMLREIAGSGLRLALYGDYWSRYSYLRQYSFGRADVPLLRKLTGRAAINLCLCRRANRDGHVMRTFEIAAIGGFMIAEDTMEHRELFGQEGECVLYFKNGREAIEKACWAMQHPNKRRRMAVAAHERIVRGPNTYRDRLQRMLALRRFDGKGAL